MSCQQVPITQPGVVHGMVLWWQLMMDPSDPSNTLSTAPVWVTDVAHGADASCAVTGADTSPIAVTQSSTEQAGCDQGSTQQQQQQHTEQDQCASVPPPLIGALSEPPPLIGALSEPPPLIRQGWRDHWKQCWSGVAATGLQVGCTSKLVVESLLIS